MNEQEEAVIREIYEWIKGNAIVSGSEEEPILHYFPHGANVVRQKLQDLLDE